TRARSAGEIEKSASLRKSSGAFSEKTTRKLGSCSGKLCARLRGRTRRKQNPCPRDERILLAGARSEIGKRSRHDRPSLANHRTRAQARDRSFEGVQGGHWKAIALEGQSADFRNPPGRN